MASVGTSVRDNTKEAINGEHDRLGHRHEQVAGTPFSANHRHEDDAYAEQRHEGGRHDLLRAVPREIEFDRLAVPDAS